MLASRVLVDRRNTTSRPVSVAETTPVPVIDHAPTRIFRQPPRRSARTPVRALARVITDPGALAHPRLVLRARGTQPPPPEEAPGTPAPLTPVPTRIVRRDQDFEDEPTKRR